MSLGVFAMRAALAAGVVAAAEDIRDIRGPKFVPPAWALPAIAAVAALLALAAYGWWRWRRRAARVLLPHEVALERLEEIRVMMQPGQAREFSNAASDVIRAYIEQRFGIVATRRTTEEFLRELLDASDASLTQHRALLGEFLQQCDTVRFAALPLTPHSMELLRQSARTFVLATAEAAV